MIREAVISDLDPIKKLTVSCAVALQEKDIFQWNEHYPSRDKLREDIEKGNLYLYEEAHEILGIVVLFAKMDKEYLPIKWLTPNGNNLYVHRLATHPAVWGKGYGRILMDFAEKQARQKGYVSVRLDTFSQNKRNHKFYESRGYVRLGNVFFPKQSEHPFFCYEKVLD